MSDFEDFLEERGLSDLHSYREPDEQEETVSNNSSNSSIDSFPKVNMSKRSFASDTNKQLKHWKNAWQKAQPVLNKKQRQIRNKLWRNQFGFDFDPSTAEKDLRDLYDFREEELIDYELDSDGECVEIEVDIPAGDRYGEEFLAAIGKYVVLDIAYDPHSLSQSVSQSVSQSASQSVSQSVSQCVSHSNSENDTQECVVGSVVADECDVSRLNGLGALRSTESCNPVDVDNTFIPVAPSDLDASCSDASAVIDAQECDVGSVVADECDVSRLNGLGALRSTESCNPVEVDNTFIPVAPSDLDASCSDASAVDNSSTSSEPYNRVGHNHADVSSPVKKKKPPTK